MNNILKLISEIPPSVNHYLGYTTRGKGKKSYAVSYKTETAKKYQRDFIQVVKQEVRKQKWKMSDNKFQHYYMDVDFYFPRVDMDANNYFKVIADVITESGCVWIDDTQLCERVQSIRYDTENPRLEIEIKPVEYIGLFQNKAENEKFLEVCSVCKRNNKACSTYRNAAEGRIKNDIQNGICIKYVPIKKERN